MTALLNPVDQIILRRSKRLITKTPNPDYDYLRYIEKEARYETWLAYRHRNDSRLFDPGPHVGAEHRQWEAMEDMWWGKAIGCVPVNDQEYLYPNFETDVLVGRFNGVDRGWFGSVDFVVGHFTGPGTSTHRSPLNIGFVHILSEPYQEIIDKQYRDEDDYVED